MFGHGSEFQDVAARHCEHIAHFPESLEAGPAISIGVAEAQACVDLDWCRAARGVTIVCAITAYDTGDAAAFHAAVATVADGAKAALELNDRNRELAARGAAS